MADWIEVDDPQHPSLRDFLALNQPDERRQVERHGDYFVVEGIVAIERLLTLPDWSVRCIAVLPRMAERLRDRLDEVDATVIVTQQTVLEQVVGFDIHRGALASVRRRPTPPWDTAARAGSLLVAAEGLNDHENLGSLYRNAAAFGVSAVVLDPACADPFYRRSVRVSLGHVLAVPTLQIGPMPIGIKAMQDSGVLTVALTPSGTTSLEDLRIPANAPVALVVGAEGPGLCEATLYAADHRVAIPMADGVDSLNVATAAAIALNHLRLQLGQSVPQ